MSNHFLSFSYLKFHDNTNYFCYLYQYMCINIMSNLFKKEPKKLALEMKL